MLPFQTPAVPQLAELLARTRENVTPPSLLGPLASAIPNSYTTLDSLMSPYAPSFDPYGGGILDSLGGGAPGGNIGLGSTPPGGGASSGFGGGTGPAYTGPPDPSVAQWEAGTENGRIPMNDLMRVPMNTSALVNRLEGAKPWEDVNMRLPNADRDFLMPEAAQSWRAMMRDAAGAGVPLVFGQSYRSYPEQVAIAQEKGIYGQGGLAAVPGTSNHGEGLAVDLNLGASPTQRDWLLNNADKYGWYFPMGDEPWHIQYEGGYDPGQGFSPDFRPSWTPGAGSADPPAATSSRGTAGTPRRRSPSSSRTNTIDRLIREGI